ncbi:hypothetical protein ASPSYDRAFT_89830 [Aspergillus sydowii CBS 593.65]|uniref:Zn(2)-C6 fungal-type domain-containing protein n=1 Tax=Aspergillus sydowii CBS 593.65 TaxID=1036612 RepID=A0A1L9TI75_9EURO|nr:uncharacterized protein ASPSYDRAFT_89830 [Aspergillus sydowii CBS 593.65]OJJ59112.1 hypothetical protein ASPSYDRAFT_89830 [Aspergillus sydowii CBS 593.65]
MGTNKDKRRVVNACARCRQHKIKCSGDSPCSNCRQRKVRCKFEGEESKVHITKKHFSGLKLRNRELEEENRALQQRLEAHLNAISPVPVGSSSPGPTPPLNHPSVPSAVSSMKPAGDGQDQADEDDGSSTMVNPLSCGPPKYITDTAGRPHYLGHTSSWSLTIRLLHLTHQALYKCPFPSAAHHIDTMTYSLQWNGLRSPVIPDIRGLPSLDHALFLVNATKFRTGQIFHLFDEPRFMAQLHQFYNDPCNPSHTDSLWFIHFLVIMALGKAFIGEKNRGTSPPGAEYFTRAFMMLPDYSFMWKDPCTSAELLCAMALYLQSIDWRTSAHNLIGQALRIMQVHGYHTNVSGVTNSKDLIRCQNIWWTVYVLERQISVLLGVPLAINDSDITASLPNDADSLARSLTIAIHVKLSQAFSQVVNALYKGSENLNSSYVKTTQDVLQRVADVASGLREYFPVPEPESLNGISRVSGYLNLLYHQCIMLAIRPFLFGLVETCVALDNPGMTVPPMPIQLLLQVCLESAKKTVFILNSLHDQTLLEWFLPFDLESAVSAGLVVIMATVACPSLIESPESWLDSISTLLDQIIDKGNLIAADQKRELNELQGLCAKLTATPRRSRRPNVSQSYTGVQPKPGAIQAPLSPDNTEYMVETGLAGDAEAEARDMCPGPGQIDTLDWARDMTPSQLLEVVDMLNGDDLLNWMDIPSGYLGNGDID